MEDVSENEAAACRPVNVIVNISTTPIMTCNTSTISKGFLEHFSSSSGSGHLCLVTQLIATHGLWADTIFSVYYHRDWAIELTKNLFVVNKQLWSGMHISASILKQQITSGQKSKVVSC